MQMTGDSFFRLDSVKAMIDGSLGTKTAYFFEDYVGTPGFRGYLIWDLPKFHDLLLSADKAGRQLCVHAIGDHAVAHTLDIFADIAQKNGPRDRRMRIEHAQHIREEDIPRFGSQQVIASMQMSHLADDGRWAPCCLGMDRMKGSWPANSLLRHGAKLAFGSDWFVTKPCPLEGIHAAVTRQTKDGANPGGLIPEEKITVEQALRAYTIDAAYAGFDDDLRGSLTVGKLADLVVLDTDLTACHPDEIMSTKVLTTFVGGKIVTS